MGEDVLSAFFHFATGLVLLFLADFIVLAVYGPTIASKTTDSISPDQEAP